MTEDRSIDDLVRQVQEANGQERDELLDRLVAEFADAAYRWAQLILDDEDKAYDAVQEAWLNAYLHLGQLRERAAFPGWFRQIVLNSSYRALRGDKPSISLTEELPEETPHQSDPVEEMEHHERLEHIREAVLGLPEGERVVTELYYFDDYSQQEIAEILSIPVTTIKKRLQYARRHLKGAIQPEIVSSLDAYTLNGGCTAAALGIHADRFLEWLPLVYEPDFVGMGGLR
ncbi:MAG TPA: sigma-70 family RNA polymerase sigma factor [Aggregatilineales bacterium]|nr:sigma-70 family RNA polymerase sigma factor [Aggregatilineales bacterium]